MSRQRALVLFSFLLQASFAVGFTIENISGPGNSAATNEIRRYAIYLAGEIVKYGRCDVTEARCLPNSPTFETLRELAYDTYQTHLANLFNVDPRYVKFHEKQEINFKSITTTLQQILSAEGPSDEEKRNAKEKFDTLTEKGGIIDRFTQAVAIKKSLAWDENSPEKKHVAFEKAQRQFAQSAWPMNFAPDLKSDSPNTIFEPSTERFWHFAGNGLNRREAAAACDKLGKGYALPRYEALKLAAAWLTPSRMGDLIEKNPSGSTGKAIWLGGIDMVREESGREERATSQYSSRTVTVVLYKYVAQFPLVFLTEKEKEPVTKTYVPVDTGKDDRLYEFDAVENFGGKTRGYTTLCVREAYDAI